MSATIAKTKELVKDDILKLFKMSRTPRAADADDHGGFADKLCPYLYTMVKKNAVKVRIQLVHGDWTKISRFPSYHTKTVNLEK